MIFQSGQLVEHGALEDLGLVLVGVVVEFLVAIAEDNATATAAAAGCWNCRMGFVVGDGTGDGGDDGGSVVDARTGERSGSQDRRGTADRAEERWGTAVPPGRTVGPATLQRYLRGWMCWGVQILCADQGTYRIVAIAADLWSFSRPSRVARGRGPGWRYTAGTCRCMLHV